MTQIIATDTLQEGYSELSRILPKIAESLGVDKKDLCIVSPNAVPMDYMNTKYRDRFLDSYGTLPGFPAVKLNGDNSDKKQGYGIYVFQSHADSNIKYAIFRIKLNWDEEYLIIDKKDLYKFKRNAIKLNKQSDKNLKSPILEDGLIEEVLKNTLGFILKSKDIEKYGVKIKRGIILGGSPGNGKTMLCRYIQKLCSINDIKWGKITSSDIDNAYAEGMLDSLFQKWTVTFFDDIDIGYMDRSKGNGKMACSLLTAMDGMLEGEHVVRIFTTNEEVNKLDPAFIRPGRIDKILNFKKPTKELRQKLLETWPKEIINNIDVNRCIEMSSDFSFAELEAIRGYLVTNKILGDGTWDLDLAFEEFNLRREEDNKINKQMGFGKKIKPKKFKNKKHNSLIEELLPKRYSFEQNDYPENSED